MPVAASAVSARIQLADNPLPLMIVFRSQDITMKEKYMVLGPSIRLALAGVLILAFFSDPSDAMISIGVLSKKDAKEKYGITMHARKNGDAGIKVWLQFKKEGWLKQFTYAELRMEDQGKHVLSAMLQPNPVHHRQPKGITTVSFSADPKELARCKFLVVCYGSNEGDVGYYLNLKDFLDLENPVTEK